jgi:dTDP-glucose 4,6-dehydratase
MICDYPRERHIESDTIVVTGGAGFIGTNFILQWLASNTGRVLNLDKLTYAGNSSNFADFADNHRHHLIIGDIGDRELVRTLLDKDRPRAVINFAAESHVDRSIHAPDDFIKTNVVGTINLLEAALTYWHKLSQADQQNFRFIHISTDEVFGSLGPDDPPFSETTPYAPNSPYAASKAASDHLVRAWHHTYGLPTIVLNSSNNYGPYQFPEKLIPLMIHHALEGNPLPLYGDGLQVRDWVFTSDFCSAIILALDRGTAGSCFTVGGRSERTNRSVVETICSILDTDRPRQDGCSYRQQITSVTDRQGHDRRYAIDCSRIERELGWRPVESFDSGIRKTVRWYLENPEWLLNVTSGSYREWIIKNYTARSSTTASA